MIFLDSPIKAGELIANLEKQMRPFQHDVCLEEEVTHLAQEADGLLRLETTKGTHYSKRLSLRLVTALSNLDV